MPTNRGSFCAPITGNRSQPEDVEQVEVHASKTRNQDFPLQGKRCESDYQWLLKQEVFPGRISRRCSSVCVLSASWSKHVSAGLHRTQAVAQWQIDMELGIGSLYGIEILGIDFRTDKASVPDRMPCILSCIGVTQFSSLVFRNGIL